jgi:glycosyltransferase involved in cell wall biosynthesis
MPEVAGGAALLADPHDAASIAEALLRFANDENLRAQFAHLGRERAAELPWEKAVRDTWAIYDELR